MAARPVPPGRRAGAGATSAVTARLLVERRSRAAERARGPARRGRAPLGAAGAAEKASRAADDRGRGLSAASVFAAMSRLVPEDAVIAVDVGNNTYSLRALLRVRAASRS